jgi:superfamily II DNA or RNA helicase
VTLRTWQKEAIDWALRTDGHRLIQAPPGCGKSRVGYTIAAHWLERGAAHRVFWAAPSIALVEQAHQAAWQHLRTPAFVSRSLVRAPRAARLVVTTHQSAVRFLVETRPTDLLIFDEAHHANQAAIANFSTCARHAQCLGLSASPWSPGCLRAFPTRWIYPLSRALRDGALLPPCLHGDLPTQPAPRTLHFVESVAAARRAARELGVLHFVQGDPLTKLGPWLRGSVPDLFACRRLCEGYDVPECARVVIHHQIKSPIWTYQAVGRALRQSPGKTHGHAFGLTGHTQTALQLALALADGHAPAQTTTPEGEDHVTDEIPEDRNHQSQEPKDVGDHLRPRRRPRHQTEEAKETQCRRGRRQREHAEGEAGPG